MAEAKVAPSNLERPQMGLIIAEVIAYAVSRMMKGKGTMTSPWAATWLPNTIPKLVSELILSDDMVK